MERKGPSGKSNVELTVASYLLTLQFNNFLVAIGAHICRTRDTNFGSQVLATVKDKVAQDVDNSEGTGVWTCEEGARLHVSIPTIVAAHLFRVTSAHANLRHAVNEAHPADFETKELPLRGKQKDEFIKQLHSSTYMSFLLAYIQGLHLVASASK